MKKFYTPPLLEYDFSVAYQNDGQELLQTVVVDDAVVETYRNHGTLSHSIINGTDDRPVSFTVLNPESGEVRGHRYQATSNAPAVIKASSPVLDKVVIVPNTIESMAVRYAEGTVGQALTDAVNALSEGKTPSSITLPLFINRVEETGVYQWNPSCWAYPVDLTCMAPWRDRLGVSSDTTSQHHHWPVVAITPRHVVCGHVGTWVNEGYHFFARDNTLAERRVISIERIAAGMPYWVALLDADLPPAITPAKLLPSNVSSFIKSLSQLKIPCLATNQLKELFINPLSSFGTTSSNQLLYFATVGEWSKQVIGGDSSSPVFCTLDGQTILLTTWWYGDGGSGLDYSRYAEDINVALDALHGGSSPYYPEIIDLSAYSQFS